MATTLDWDGNLLLACVAEADRPLLAPHLRSVELSRGAVLFEPGDDVTMTYFPCRGTIISLVTMLQDGHALEAAVVGYEGSIGGVVSFGHKPAFARMTVEIGGAAWCMATERLDEAKARSPALHDLFSRYADVMLAQTLQSVACNALHSIEQRACRWLLTMQERVGDGAVVPVSQEYLANLLGVSGARRRPRPKRSGRAGSSVQPRRHPDTRPRGPRGGELRLLRGGREALPHAAPGGEAQGSATRPAAQPGRLTQAAGQWRAIRHPQITQL